MRSFGNIDLVYLPPLPLPRKRNSPGLRSLWAPQNLDSGWAVEHERERKSGFTLKELWTRVSSRSKTSVFLPDTRAGCCPRRLSSMMGWKEGSSWVESSGWGISLPKTHDVDWNLSRARRLFLEDFPLRCKTTADGGEKALLFSRSVLSCFS